MVAIHSPRRNIKGIRIDMSKLRSFSLPFINCLNVLTKTFSIWMTNFKEYFSFHYETNWELVDLINGETDLLKRILLATLK